MKLDIDTEWFKRMADLEAECESISAGGMYVAMSKLQEQVDKNPWLKEFDNELSIYCPDCGVMGGQTHKDGCDVAMCSLTRRQFICCECKEGEPDVWMGLTNPYYHKIALEKGLWCRSLMIQPDGTVVPAVTTEQHHELHKINIGLWDGQYPGWKIKFHVPCDRTDPGSYADLNRAIESMNV